MTSTKHGRTLLGAAFLLSAAGTAFLLTLLAVLGPFAERQSAPPLLWSIVLWGAVGMVTFVLLLRVALFAVTTLYGAFAVGKRGAVAMAHLLKVTIGSM